MKPKLEQLAERGYEEVLAEREAEEMAGRKYLTTIQLIPS